jgi:hypothetical protein
MQRWLDREVSIFGSLLCQLLPIHALSRHCRDRKRDIGDSHYAGAAHDRFSFVPGLACDLKGVALLELWQEEFHRERPVYS